MPEDTRANEVETNPDNEKPEAETVARRFAALRQKINDLEARVARLEAIERAKRPR